jgi:hypothetical protein
MFWPPPKRRRAPTEAAPAMERHLRMQLRRRLCGMAAGGGFAGAAAGGGFAGTAAGGGFAGRRQAAASRDGESTKTGLAVFSRRSEK